MYLFLLCYDIVGFVMDFVFVVGFVIVGFFVVCMGYYIVVVVGIFFVVVGCNIVFDFVDNYYCKIDFDYDVVFYLFW